MCGIAGYVDLRTRPSTLRGKLEHALRQLAHRGPDGSGSWFSTCQGGELGIGHTRLSILDLTARGSQPMHSNPQRYVLSYNGEIYNYLELRQELEQLGEVFRTESDTEVLLAAWKQWGAQCLPKLNGMFAFAVYDSRDCVLTLARDRHGMKPLYFANENDFAVYSSEPPIVAGLLGKTSPNHQKIYEYLTMGLYDLDDQTFFEGVFALEPGHLATIEASQGKLTFAVRRWSEDKPSDPIDIGFEPAAETVRELFLDSVNLHLRSDVPVAVALSGGLDSSGIVGAVRHLYPDREIHTFSYVSPGFSKDESRWATMVSEELGTQHHHVRITAEEAQASLRRVVREQGEPTNSSSVIAQSCLYEAVAVNGFKVLLDGQGADELFAGYSGYPEFRLRSLFSQHRFGEALQFAAKWKSWAPGNSISKLIPMFIATYTSGALAGHGARLVGRGAYPSWVDRRVLSHHGGVAGVPRSVPGYPVFDAPNSRFLQQHLFTSQSGGDLRRLLRHGDRSSMAHSVESRLPYLSLGLVDFVNSLPESFLLAKNGETKHVLRNAIKGLVPLEILGRRDKVGFETPEAEWLRATSIPGKAWEAGLAHFDWIKREQLSSIVADSTAELAWRARNLSIWSEEFL